MKISIVILDGCSSRLVRANPGITSTSDSTSVFVIGGIHQSHEAAKKYTYQRMGEIFEQLHPDVLCVEVEQKYLDDNSEKGMPFDFKKFMLPAARKMNVKIFGIDWIDPTRHGEWQSLQAKIAQDPTLTAQIQFYGGLFRLLNQYFQEMDFQEINSGTISNLWRGMDNFKYEVLSHNPKYGLVVEYD